MTLYSEKRTEALRICEELLREVENMLHAQNFQVIKIVDKISDVCIEMGLWNKAIHYCKRSLDGYLKFYPKYHPSTAIQLYRIGRYWECSDLHNRRMINVEGFFYHREPIVNPRW
jgi:hypothetical protein